MDKNQNGDPAANQLPEATDTNTWYRNNSPTALPATPAAPAYRPQPPAEQPATGGFPEPPHHEDDRKWWQKISRRQWILIVVVAFICFGGVGAFVYFSSGDKPVQPVQKTAKAPASAAPIVSPLSGMPVETADLQRPVTGVMIENTPFARPQSGLPAAGVVYEAIAEYGITRFLALYQEGKPANLGPIRSARPYFIDWALGYNASYGHVGGSPEALAKIKRDHVNDLDQQFNGNYYRRITSRAAPHNVYTTANQLDALNKAKGWFKPASFSGFVRKAEAKAIVPSITKIDLGISTTEYHVHYDYNLASNSYFRSEGGKPHTDFETKQQLHPKVVIALIAAYRLEADGYHSYYQINGRGQAIVFQDGGQTSVTWQKDNGRSPLKLTGADGKPFALDAGQTWITALDSPNKIVAKP